MIDLVWFEISQPTSVALASLIILSIALVWSIVKLLGRTRERHISYSVLLVTLNLGVFIALAGLILAPGTKEDVSDKVVVYTSGESIGKAQNLSTKETSGSSDAKAHYALMDLSEIQTADKVQNATRLNHIQNLVVKSSDVSTLVVKGDGLIAEEWQELKQVSQQSIQIEYTPPQIYQGFTNISWTRFINLGDYLHLQGKIHSNDSRVNSVVLYDPAGDKVGEFKLLAGESFSISSKPKLPGRHTYRVALLDSKSEEILSENIYIQVTEVAKAKILVYQSAPSFETKQLQNWAAENGAQMVVNTKISKDKFITRLTNIQNIEAKVLNQDVLGQFHLLVMDGRFFSEMSVGQKTSIENAVTQGLGLLVIADKDLLKLSNSNWPDWIENLKIIRQSESQELVPYWSDNFDGLTAPRESYISTFSAQFNSRRTGNLSQTLVQAANGLPLVKKVNYGLGNVGVSLIRETYQWVTNGDQTSHSHYWQSLIRQLSRSIEKEFDFNVGTKLPIVGERLQLCINAITEIDDLVVVNASDVSDRKPIQQNLSVVRDSKNENRYCGFFWPKRIGWYQISSFNEASQKVYQSWFHVYPQDSWRAMQQQKKIRDTIRFKQSQANIEQLSPVEKSRPINPWVFWWIFVVCVSLIWAENKYLKE